MISKILTISSILAAGTLAASAGTVLTLTDLSTATTVDSIAYSVSGTTGTLEGSALFSSATASDRPSTAVTFALNLTELGISSTTTTLASGTSISLVNVQTSSSSTSNSIGLLATENGLQYSWGGSLWSSYSNFYVSYASLLEKSYTVDGNTYVTLTLQTNQCFYVTQGTAHTGTMILFADGSEASANNGSSIKASSLTSEAAYNDIILNLSYIDAVSVFAGIATTSEIASIS